jgi:probable HAF family extracellular repeat protein
MLAAAAHADVAWFSGVGAAPGGGQSGAIGVSADGSTVVGNFGSQGSSGAFRWTRAGGLQVLGGFNEPGQSAYALGISGDGATVVGVSYVPDGAFRWTQGQGPQLLPAANAYATSFDGSVVVGEAYNDCGTTAYRWTASTGVVLLGTLTGQCDGGYSSARGVSSDGSVVVGLSDPAIAAVHHVEAFRWTSASGLQGLGLVPGQIARSFAHAVSADGSVIVGESDNTNGEAFRWSHASGILGLGDLPGGPFNSRAFGVSGDGSVVVGSGNFGAPTEAFIWTAQSGMRRLRDVLRLQYGLNLAGWNLTFALAVSDDGCTIVGEAVNACGVREGWVAHLGDERVCSADFNTDGRLSVQDIFDFLSAWFAGSAASDFNGCGLSVQDIFDYLDAWFVGC